MTVHIGSSRPGGVSNSKIAGLPRDVGLESDEGDRGRPLLAFGLFRAGFLLARGVNQSLPSKPAPISDREIAARFFFLEDVSGHRVIAEVVDGDRVQIGEKGFAGLFDRRVDDLLNEPRTD